MSRYSVLLEPIKEPGFEGYYCAHVPALDLTTHGQGVEGALGAARDLVEVWLAEKRSRGENVPAEGESFVTHIEVSDTIHGA